MTDYLKYYDLERYLFCTVGPNFRSSGQLNHIDLFLILIWKSNRAKTKNKKKLEKGYGKLKAAATQLASELFAADDPKQRLSILMGKWELSLPTASAILTVLYPDEFTIYDYRACDALGRPNSSITFSAKSDKWWNKYQEFKKAVYDSGPGDRSLRDKDRALWAKSFYMKAKEDAEK